MMNFLENSNFLVSKEERQITSVKKEMSETAMIHSTLNCCFCDLFITVNFKKVTDVPFIVKSSLNLSSIATAECLRTTCFLTFGIAKLLALTCLRDHSNERKNTVNELTSQFCEAPGQFVGLKWCHTENSYGKN